ncbi:hypothetical protein BC629DRAFT_1595569 [Irpex lacteus]|nr:hypothetical protein BC629DRAFT_1595569 [Irpex lacteus]
MSERAVEPRVLTCVEDCAVVSSDSGRLVIDPIKRRLTGPISCQANTQKCVQRLKLTSHGCYRRGSKVHQYLSRAVFTQDVELDLGPNHIVHKWSELTEPRLASSDRMTVPPQHVRSHRRPHLREDSDRGLNITASAMHEKQVFTIEHDEQDVRALKIECFDTVPTASSLCTLKSDFSSSRQSLAITNCTRSRSSATMSTNPNSSRCPVFLGHGRPYATFCPCILDNLTSVDEFEFWIPSPMRRSSDILQNLDEGDHRVLAEDVAQAKLAELESQKVDENLLDLPPDVFGRPKAPTATWASGIRIIDPVNATIVNFIALDNDESAFSISVVFFAAQGGEQLLVDLELLHKTEANDVPLPVLGFQGRLVARVSNALRLHDMDKKKLFRKTFSSAIVTLATQGFHLSARASHSPRVSLLLTMLPLQLLESVAFLFMLWFSNVHAAYPYTKPEFCTYIGMWRCHLRLAVSFNHASNNLRCSASATLRTSAKDTAILLCTEHEDVTQDLIVEYGTIENVPVIDTTKINGVVNDTIMSSQEYYDLSYKTLS